MLAFGALVATASGAASADNVPVEVKVIQSDVSPPSGYSPPWGCSETQPGPGNALHVICVNPEKVATKPPRTGDPVQITWNLSGAGWTFPAGAGGIFIKKKNTWVITADSATQYSATNKRETGKTYSYTVNVLNGTYLLTWDPTIMN
jgi:hypothetical protein